MITFDEKSHTYYKDGKPIENVTSYIERHKQPFQKEIIAQKTAERDGRTTEDVLNEWSLKGKMARELGSSFHGAMEYSKYGEPDNPLLAIIARGYQNEIRGKDVVREVCVYDDELIGTIDELEIIDKEKKIANIIDDKTNGSLYKEKSKKLLPPFDYLTDAPIDVYSLQLSLYKRLLEYHGWTIEKMFIRHITIGIHDDKIAVNFERIEVKDVVDK